MIKKTLRNRRNQNIITHCKCSSPFSSAWITFSRARRRLVHLSSKQFLFSSSSFFFSLCFFLFRWIILEEFTYKYLSDIGLHIHNIGWRLVLVANFATFSHSFNYFYVGIYRSNISSASFYGLSYKIHTN